MAAAQERKKNAKVLAAAERSRSRSAWESFPQRLEAEISLSRATQPLISRGSRSRRGRAATATHTQMSAETKSTAAPSSFYLL